MIIETNYHLYLSEYISPSIMVPEHRLETLLEQAITLQRISCLYHNTNEYISLYSDHICDRYFQEKIFYQGLFSINLFILFILIF